MKYHSNKNMNSVLEASKTTLLSDAQVILTTLMHGFYGHPIFFYLNLFHIENSLFS